MRSLLLSSLLRTPFGAALLPHPVLRSIPRCAPPSSCQAPSPAAPAPAHRAPTCCALCPVPRVCWGAADAAVPHQKVVAAVEAMAVAMCNLSKEMLRLKRMFQVFQIFQRYVVIVSYRCCKSILEDVAKIYRRMLHMLQVFQRHVFSALEVCSKCFICSRCMLKVF
jgi:hypothetical protein